MTVQEWYSSPETHKEFERVLATTALKGAVELLQARARVGQLRTTSLNDLALQHAVASGYQKALDDLIALSKPMISRKPATVPKHWEPDEKA